MKFVLHTNVISPHQLPLARELVRHLGEDEFRYVYTETLMAERQRMGWCADGDSSWIRQCEVPDGDLESCEVLLSGLRDLDLFERRAQNGLRALYMSERWFKPLRVLRLFGSFDCSIPGWVRMLVPSYRKMAKRFVRWIQNDPNGRVFAIGPWAKKDMLRLGVPESKIIPWGYFVAPSVQQSNNRTIEQSNNLKVLWVGRMLHWKRVDTIVRAVRVVERVSRSARRTIQLTLVGDGPEKERLQSLATQTLKHSNTLTIEFLPSQPIDKIREIMRSHDVYVLSSDAQEGWGAALNEALEEGMAAIGTYEAGSSATILSDEWLFHAGDWRRLSKLLARCVEMKAAGTLRGQGIGEWSAQKAAERLLELIG